MREIMNSFDRRKIAVTICCSRVLNLDSDLDWAVQIGSQGGTGRRLKFFSMTYAFEISLEVSKK
jgi:hypothetical protein